MKANVLRKEKGGKSLCLCKECKKEFLAANGEINRGRAIYCSRRCYQSSDWFTERIKLSGNGRWNGGRMIHANGYVFIKSHSHPFANNQNYVQEHRLVMEKYLGRYLSPKEVVHHRNRIRTDNSIENLQLFASNSEHHSGNKDHRTGRKKVFFRCIIPDCERKNFGRYCRRHYWAIKGK